MDAIKQIEAILENKYGTPPTVAPMTAKGVALEVWKKKGMTPSAVRAAIAFCIPRECEAGVYTSYLHSIFLNPTLDHETADFVLVHEHMHGYIHQQNTAFEDCRQAYLNWRHQAGWATLKSMMHLGKPCVDNSQLEEILVLQAVDEGLCDYVAVRAALANGKTIGLKMDKALTGYFPQPYSLESDPGKLTAIKPEVMKQVRKMWEEAKDPAGFDDYLSFFNWMTKLIDHQTYSMGYIAMRLALGDRTKNVGKKINRIIKSPPKSFDQLDRLVAQCRKH